MKGAQEITERYLLPVSLNLMLVNTAALLYCLQGLPSFVRSGQDYAWLSFGFTLSLLLLLGGLKFRKSGYHLAAQGLSIFMLIELIV